MKRALDRFSEQADFYKKFRPQYPADLYREILKVTPGREKSWDCGTGNGQVASEMSRHFKQVYAADISEEQLGRAPKLYNVHYRVERAEKTRFPNSYFDLITVAQAIHWFDIPLFYKEVQRVGKPQAILAIWGYGLMQISKKVDPLILRFYTDVVGPYWDPERKYIEDRYQTIDFPFSPIEFAKTFQIVQRMDLSEMHGYLNSWSAVQQYIKKKGTNPVRELLAELQGLWPAKIKKHVTFPIFIQTGRILK